MNVNTAITPGKTVDPTIDRAEVDKFSQMAATWWDETGTSGPLHRLNPSRMRYIRDQAVLHFLSPRERSTDRNGRSGEGLTAWCRQ